MPHPIFDDDDGEPLTRLESTGIWSAVIALCALLTVLVYHLSHWLLALIL